MTTHSTAVRMIEYIRESAPKLRAWRAKAKNDPKAPSDGVVACVLAGTHAHFEVWSLDKMTATGHGPSVAMATIASAIIEMGNTPIFISIDCVDGQTISIANLEDIEQLPPLVTDYVNFAKPAGKDYVN